MVHGQPRQARGGGQTVNRTGGPRRRQRRLSTIAHERCSVSSRAAQPASNAKARPKALTTRISKPTGVMRCDGRSASAWGPCERAAASTADGAEGRTSAPSVTNWRPATIVRTPASVSSENRGEPASHPVRVPARALGPTPPVFCTALRPYDPRGWTHARDPGDAAAGRRCSSRVHHRRAANVSPCSPIARAERELALYDRDDPDPCRDRPAPQCRRHPALGELLGGEPRE